ncbi:sensor histidine kinase [Clostridium cellulovorans]|uniref:histidine kinase n=1 Tax=Clostridium cellulovorans (strain ATCC 35296 / DSM 3052 / OCM 3 / 743B) TaxID=573061 RepID=D9SVR6_CLOC7|nr:HAMP domain-containing sensor histidine kinase [Clostridium cellulovorans]ADL53127.1 integral membrane sensor signal transduction histidine kinase [Clostridium cellulovorans 743B]
MKKFKNVILEKFNLSKPFMKGDLLRSSKIKLLATNVAFFVGIISIFSLIIFNYIKINQYKSIDMEITKSINDIPRLMTDHRPKPDIIVILWDTKGNIIDISTKSNFFEENKTSFFPKSFDTIQSLSVSDSSFRTESVKVKAYTGDTIYAQVLISSNSEDNALSNIFVILTIGGSLVIILSVFASYFLAKQNMKPILLAWQKQKEFVEDASHEMRTPLTVVQTKLELLLREPNAKIIDKYDYIAPALSETGRLSRLVGNLLTLARADSNTTEIIKEEIEVNSLISKICEPYIEIAELEDKKIFINLSNKIYLPCDKDRIHQLMVILLDNALKYTVDNGIIIVNSYIKDTKWFFQVIDNGIGIKEENLGKVFERFFREDKARSRETGGSGLGLSIAKWIVTKHGGTIKAMRNQPTGTIIEVKIPINPTTALKEI